jgi:hypothetical protein
MTVFSVAFSCGLIGAILVSIEAGYRIGLRRRARGPEFLQRVPPTLEGSVFGLMGLLIAFTFYGAGSRFDIRRNLIAQEANAIGTAYLRLDVLPPETQPKLREDFRNYVRSRLDVYRQIPDTKAVNAALDRSSALQRNVWKEAVEALKGSGTAEKALVLGSLNEMIDITTTRTVALTTHVPGVVLGMLALTVVASSALAGYTMSAYETRDWACIIAYALVVGAVVYAILDYEYPRAGFVRIDPVDQVLARTLEQMN